MILSVVISPSKADAVVTAGVAGVVTVVEVVEVIDVVLDAFIVESPEVLT